MVETQVRAITSGTKEWSKNNLNTHKGCPHNCGYCYAKMIGYNKGWKEKGTWCIMEPKSHIIEKKYRKIKNDNPKLYDYMYPSAHDIVPEIVDISISVLEKILVVGNTVLVVSKAWTLCTDKITDALRKYQDQINYRFTITSSNKERLAFWEPNAPPLHERLNSLSIAYKKGFTTSVSIEPFLDQDPIPLIKKVAQYATESIWIGKMNYIKAKGISNEEKPNYDYIRSISSRKNILKILGNISQLPEEIKGKIRLKDSIRKMNK
ncbi:hypothetical protein LCGC14_1625070 [marine sediment metagenome]|uniref:Radical SAM core domain-containing protein n=1 Tax=marine sediment metagenome TaxID=412755 RepID=A0A0F9I4I3_9ZZZZ